MVLFDRTQTDVIIAAVVAFTDHRIDRIDRYIILLTAIYDISYQRIMYQTDVHGIGQCDRRFDPAKLLDLH